MRVALRKVKGQLLAGFALTICFSVIVFVLERRELMAASQTMADQQVQNIQQRIAVAGTELDAASAFVVQADPSLLLFDNFLDRLSPSRTRDSSWAWARVIDRTQVEQDEAQVRMELADPNYSIDRSASLPILTPVVSVYGDMRLLKPGQDASTLPEVAALLQDYQSTSEISRPALILGSSGKRGSGSIFIARLLVHDARAPGRMKNPNLLVQGMSLLALRQAGALEARQSLSLAWADKPDRPALVSDVQGGASSKWSAVQEADIAGNKILIRLKGYPEWQWPRLWILALSAGALATMLYGTFRSGQLIRFEANSLDRALTTTENRLAETERRENAFFENAGTANCETDFKTGKLLRVNDALCELFGYSREELLNMSFLDITHPGDHHLSTTALVDENGHPRPSVQFEKRYCRKDGQFLWGLVNGRLHVSNSGEPLSYLTVIVDISVRKRDEEVKTMLLRELAHRVRNTVQLVASLSRQSARRARSVADYEGKFNKRLTALSAAQDLLFDTGWKSAPVQGIAERTIKPFLPDDNLSGEVSIELPAVELPTQQAQTLAIAIHELASNSSQYGALATGGSVAFTGKVLPTTESGKQQLYIRWEEKVPRRIRRPRKSGFGMTMLESAMPDQFQGTAAFTWKNTGLVYEALLTLDAFG